jgi:hypothetical protein
MIYGYSERGIFNSIIYYLDANENLIGAFLEELGVVGFTKGRHTFTFLNEQSFSDFGDNDLTIIIDSINPEKKTVVFIEGKVKTFSGNYLLKKEYNNLKEAMEKNKTSEKRIDTFNGFSSNIFVQLYYKNLLQKVINSKDKKSTDFLEIDKIFKKRSRSGNGELDDRKIGINGVVVKACNKIKGADSYYYVAIIPEQNYDSDTLQKYLEKLELMKDVEEVYIQCAFWHKIKGFFEDDKLKKNGTNIVLENFKFNTGQIYNTKEN